MQENQVKNPKELIFFITYFLYFFLIARIILHAGFYSDDMANSSVRGSISLAHQGLWQYVNQAAWGLFSLGRVYPLSAYFTIFIFYFFPSIQAYHLLQALLFLINYLSVAWLIQLITKDKWAGIAFLFLIPLFWSVRHFAESLITFVPLLAPVTTFSILSVCFFMKAVQTQKWFWHFPSMLMYVLALGTYEIGVVTFFMIFACGLFNMPSKREALKSLAPSLLITCLYFALTIYVRHHTPNIYDGVQIGSGSFKDFFRTFFYQMVAALPFSYALLRHIASWVPPLFVFDGPLLPNLLALVFIFFSAWSAIYYALSRMHLDEKPRHLFYWIGAILWVIPSLMIGMSVKYQQIVGWGMGYLPVYMEYIGAALILLMLLQKTRRHLLISFILSVGIVYAYLINMSMVRYRNNENVYAHELMLSALQAGFLNTYPERMPLLTFHDVWSTPAFFMQHTGLNLQVLDIEKLTLQEIASLQNHGYFIAEFFFKDTTEGYVWLGKIQSIRYKEIDDKEHGQMFQVTEVVVKNPRVYFQSASQLLDGTYAITVRNSWDNSSMIVAAKNSPVLSQRRAGDLALAYE